MTNTPRLEQDLQAKLLPHLPQLRARAAGLHRSACDADDLVQDTIERALRKAALFESQPVPGRWLMRVMYNRFADGWRQRSKIRGLSPLDEERIASPAAYDPSAWEMVTDADVHKAMLQLPPTLQAIVRMSIVEKRCYKEISEALGIPVPTVGSRLHRARLRMKKILSAATPLNSVTVDRTSDRASAKVAFPAPSRRARAAHVG
jgi:RNA polymerase sigma-70 factor, ECF subfamily